MAKIPKFKTLEEAADFWDSHDFEDYVAETEPVTILVDIPRRQKALTIPIDLNVYRRIEALAQKRKVTIERLVSVWLKDRAFAKSTGS